GRPAGAVRRQPSLRFELDVDVLDRRSAQGGNDPRPDGALRRRRRSGMGNSNPLKRVSSDGGHDNARLRSFLQRRVHAVTFRRSSLLVVMAAGLYACGSDAHVAPSTDTTTVSNEPLTSAACPGVNFGKRPAPLTVTPGKAPSMQVLGAGSETARYTAEVAARGTTAYTTTWQVRSAPGNKIDVWDVSGATPPLVDSVIVANAIPL